MKRILVSRSHLKLFINAILLLCTFTLGVWYFAGKKLPFIDFYDIILMSSVGIVLSLYIILRFAGGIFYIGETGVGMRLLVLKKSFIPWEKIRVCGVFQSGGISIVFFATKEMPWELQERFTEKSRAKEIDWIAFAEFDRHFVKIALPYLPPDISAVMRERARQMGFEEQ